MPSPYRGFSKVLKQHKYKAVRTTVGEHSFASKAEANRFKELCLIQDSGAISGLEIQPRFPIVVNGIKICTYVADFRYIDHLNKVCVEDVKGFLTTEYKLKAKLFKALYPDLQFFEVSNRNCRRR